jgi:hypothetical protein
MLRIGFLVEGSSIGNLQSEICNLKLQGHNPISDCRFQIEDFKFAEFTNRGLPCPS